jgi:hypothetical protein
MSSITIRTGAIIFVSLALACEAAPATEYRQLDLSPLRENMKKDVCPTPPKKMVARQQDVCGGDGTHAPCGPHPTDACSKNYRACVNQFVEDQKFLNVYNKWLIDKPCFPKNSLVSEAAPSFLAKPTYTLSAELDPTGDDKPKSNEKYDCSADTHTCEVACMNAGDDILVCTRQCNHANTAPQLTPGQYCFIRVK